jgi:hypothetical protein
MNRTIVQTILCLSILLFGGCSRATKNLATLQPTFSQPVISSTKVPTPGATTTAVATEPLETVTPTLFPPTASSTKIPTPSATSTTVVIELLRESALFQALQIIPQNANYLHFINWAHIKKIEGFESVTSTSDRDEWRKFFLNARQKNAVRSAYGITKLAEHAQVWGWDTADLEWEARLINSSPPSYVLKFREDFSFAPIIARFEERGFKKSVYQGIPVYSHKIELSQDWLRATEFSILNTAVIEDAHMLVMSIDPDFVLTMIDAYQDRFDSLADKPNIQAVVSHLDDPIVAFISDDPCSVFSSQALLARQGIFPGVLDQLQAQLNDRPQLRKYEALGIEYFMEDSQPIGMIVMQFSNVEDANEDLQARQQLAQTGLVRGKDKRTYGEVFFTLGQDAKLNGRQIIFLVKPVDNDPSRLFMMIDLMDLTFATCP